MGIQFDLAWHCLLCIPSPLFYIFLPDLILLRGKKVARDFKERIIDRSLSQIQISPEVATSQKQIEILNAQVYEIVDYLTEGPAKEIEEIKRSESATKEQIKELNDALKGIMAQLEIKR
ncbi:MAG: hypothetical protein AAGA60_22225 [Cyanobacteria bacterium P01_E01_bin.42]